MSELVSSARNGIQNSESTGLNDGTRYNSCSSSLSSSSANVSISGIKADSITPPIVALEGLGVLAFRLNPFNDSQKFQIFNDTVNGLTEERGEVSKEEERKRRKKRWWICGPILMPCHYLWAYFLPYHHFNLWSIV